MNLEFLGVPKVLMPGDVVINDFQIDIFRVLVIVRGEVQRWLGNCFVCHHILNVGMSIHVLDAKFRVEVVIHIGVKKVATWSR